MIAQDGASNIAAALSDVAKLDTSSASVSMFVAVEDTSSIGVAYRRLPIGAGLASTLLSIAEKQRIALQRLQEKRGHTMLVPFDINRIAESHEIEHIDLAQQDYAPILNKLQPLSAGVAVPDLAANELTELASRFRFYVIRLSDGKQHYNFIRQMTKTMVMGHGRMAIFTDGKLEELTTPRITFDEVIHGVELNGVLFVLKRKALFDAFSFHEKLAEAAQHILTVVAGVLVIDNLDALRDEVSNNFPMKLKLAKIARSPYIHSLTVQDVKKTLERFPELRLSIGQNGDGHDALMWSEADAWTVLRVLGDDYLLSIMTDGRYSVNSKSRMAGN